MTVRFLVTYERPDDLEAFDRHYDEIHIPLAKQLPGLRRYTVSRNPRAVRGEAWYLVGELDWDDQASMRAAFASDIGRQTAADVDLMAPTGVRSMIFEVEDR